MKTFVFAYLLAVCYQALCKLTFFCAKRAVSLDLLLAIA